MNNLAGKTKHKGAKLPLKLKEYQRMRNVIREAKSRYEARNLLLVNLQVNSSLRAGDVLKLKVGDVFNGVSFVDSFWVEQQKTGQPASVAILDCILTDLEIAKKSFERLISPYYFNSPMNPLFPSHQRKSLALQPLSYSAYLTLFKKWIASIGLNPDLYGTHSLRATIPVYYYQQTGDPIATSKLFGHSKLQTTSIYLEEVAKEKAAKLRKEFYFSD